MSASQRPSPRLVRLDQILSQSPAVTPRADADPGQVMLASVPLDRIRALTQELRDRPEADADDIDALTLRLLLNDYKAAVANLRAVANAADERLHAASGEINDLRKTVRRDQEMAAKHAAREEASPTPD